MHLCSVCLVTVLMKIIPQTHERSFSISLELLIQLESDIGLSRRLFGSYCQDFRAKVIDESSVILKHFTLPFSAFIFQPYNILGDSILSNVLCGIGMRCMCVFTSQTNKWTHTCTIILCNHLCLVYSHTYKHFDYMYIWLFLMSLQEHL